jgi:serine protease Do
MRHAFIPGPVVRLASVAALAALVAAVSPAYAQTNGTQTLRELGGAFSQVAEKASPAVVFITVEKEVQRGGGPMGGLEGRGMDQLRDFLEQFFGGEMPGMPGPGPRRGPGMRGPGQRMMMGQGSGFIISPDGYVVTNNHVVGDADVVRVRLDDGREFEAETIGTDPQTEIALIKIDGQNLPTLPLGDSNALDVGEWVVAIGNPFGLSHTVTAGIVSARGRGSMGLADPGEFYADFIQTDAAINPGNSGGPLLNLDGEVVGMNTAILSRTGGSLGIGFAIPINMVEFVTQQLRDTGSIERGYLGVMIQNLDAGLADWFGTTEGALVSDVSRGSPADKAGIQADDVIVGYDGQDVESVNQLRSRVASTEPGTTVPVMVLREGDRMKRDVTIGTLSTAQAGGSAEAPADEPEARATNFGMTVGALNDRIASRVGYDGDGGVVVREVEPGSAAARAGLEPGAIVQSVNREPVDGVDAFEDAMKDAGGDRVLLRVFQRGAARYVTLNTN